VFFGGGGGFSTLRWISVKFCHLCQHMIICCLVSTPMEGNAVISAISMLCCASGPEDTQRGTHRLARKTSALSCSYLRIVVTVAPNVQACQIGPQLKISVEMVLQNSDKVHAK